MCFLITLKSLDEIASKQQNRQLEAFCPQENDSNLETCRSNSLQMTLPFVLTNTQFMLNSIMNLLGNNTLHLVDLEKKLMESLQLLNQSHSQMNIQEEDLSPIEFSSKVPEIDIEECTHDQEERLMDPLILKVFGPKKYHYRLQMKQNLPSIILKERNFDMTFELVNENGQKILNSNIIHLGLLVCDANGQWITEKKTGESFMKGKTEIEMYHGEGSFLKVYPKDVSRNYSQGKINFIVYPKPSLIKFASNASEVEEMVDFSQIEPIIIKNISIKSKKNK